jgi:IMP dehydrogenase
MVSHTAAISHTTTVPSRLDPSLETWLTRNYKINMPLVAANMDTVIGDELADLLIQNGGVPLFHRFTSLEKQESVRFT